MLLLLDCPVKPDNDNNLCHRVVVSQILKAELGIDLRGTDIADYLKTDIPFKKMDSPNSLPLNFKTEKEWCALFNKLGFNCETGKVASPFRNMVFKLVER